MTHAHHFLERLDRVPRSQTDFALSLYRDPDLVRWVLAYARLDPSEERVALSLEETRGPYVVVTREGHFVTALAEGMTTGYLRVMPRAQVDAFAARVRDMRRRKELAGELAPPGKVPTDVIALLGRRPGDLSREEMTAIGGWNPLLWRDFFRNVLMASVEIEKNLDTLFATKAKSRTADELAVATWRLAHGVGARWLLSTMGDLTWAPDLLAKWESPTGLTHACTSHRMLSTALRGWWAAARIGKPMLPLYKRAMNDEQSLTGLFDAALGATAIGLRHARCVPEAKRILELLPKVAGPKWAQQIIDGCTRALDDPDGAVESMLPAGRAMYGGLSRLLAPAPSPVRAEWDEDVTREQALLALANHDGDCMTAAAMGLLPWAARLTAPEDFYYPEETERAMRLPLLPTRTTDWLERLRNDRIVAVEPHRAAGRQGRNDPCSCGSGAKFKKCCGR